MSKATEAKVSCLQPPTNTQPLGNESLRLILLLQNLKTFKFLTVKQLQRLHLARHHDQGLQQGYHMPHDDMLSKRRARHLVRQWVKDGYLSEVGWSLSDRMPANLRPRALTVGPAGWAVLKARGYASGSWTLATIEVSRNTVERALIAGEWVAKMAAMHRGQPESGGITYFERRPDFPERMSPEVAVLYERYQPADETHDEHMLLVPLVLDVLPFRRSMDHGLLERRANAFWPWYKQWINRAMDQRDTLPVYQQPETSVNIPTVMFLCAGDHADNAKEVMEEVSRYYFHNPPGMHDGNEVYWWSLLTPNSLFHRAMHESGYMYYATEKGLKTGRSLLFAPPEDRFMPN